VVAGRPYCEQHDVEEYISFLEDILEEEDREELDLLRLMRWDYYSTEEYIRELFHRVGDLV
jgi:hypothetical protein